MQEIIHPRRQIGVILAITQVAFIIVFGFLVDYGWDATPASRRASSSSTENHVDVPKIPSNGTSMVARQAVEIPAPVSVPKVSIETYYASESTFLFSDKIYSRFRKMTRVYLFSLFLFLK